MTRDIADQRRWETIAAVAAHSTICRDPVIMPHNEGGGLLIILGDRAFRFTNGGPDIITTVWDADTGALLYAWRVCHFSDPLAHIVHAITGAVAGED